MAVNLSPYGGVGAQFLDNSGNVLTGGKIYTYAAGTTTPQVTYTSSNGATPHPNPIILDAAGRVPGGEIWLTDGLVYKFILRDANDVLIATYDGLSGINSNFVAFTNQQEIQTATAGQTVFNLTTMSYQPGTNSLSVFVDGVNQYGPGAQYAYLETDSDTVTFVNGLHVGAEVKFTTSQLNSSVSSTNAFQVSYVPPFTGSAATNVGDKLAQTVSVKDFGAVGDGITDDTAAIEAAFTVGGAVYFPSGTYLYAPTAATGFLSNTMIYGDGATSIIKYKPLSNPVTADIQQILRPRAYANVENVVIKDIVLDGNRANVTWSGVVGDGNAFGLALWGTQNVFIDNVTCQNCWTDGFYVAYTHSSIGSRRNASNIRIGNIYAYNCGRQGMSVVSCDGMTMDSFYVDGVNRTSPRAAIDLEPNVAPDKIQNIAVGQIVAKNVGAGIILAGTTLIEDVSIQTAIVNNVTNTTGISITGAKNIYVGSATILQGNGTYQALTANDYENVTIDSAFLTLDPSVVSGSVDMVKIFGTATLTACKNFSINSIIVNGARGTGVRLEPSSDVKIGYAKVENVNQALGGSWGFYLAGTLFAECLICTDGTPSYPIRLGSSTNSVVSGSITTGLTGTIALTGFTADFGALKVNGQPYQNNFHSGTGTPEGVVTANVGALYFRLNGGANTTLYVKESGTGNTGWVGK